MRLYIPTGAIAENIHIAIIRLRVAIWDVISCIPVENAIIDYFKDFLLSHSLNQDSLQANCESVQASYKPSTLSRRLRL